MLTNILLKLKGITFSKLFNEHIVDYGMRTFKFPLSFAYKMLRVSTTHVARPDKLSYDLYGQEQFGDVICKINGISNPFELNEDDIIIAPAMEYLMDFIYSNPDDIDNNEAMRLPKQKKKTEKRKANDSIIGDVRFKIDNTRRVIIY